MGYILQNTRQLRNVRDTFTKKEKPGGKGDDYRLRDSCCFSSCRVRVNLL